MKTERRKFMRDLAVSAGALGALGEGTRNVGAGNSVTPARIEKSTVRDRFWMYSTWEGFTGFPSIPGQSRMTPAEAAVYFNVPNVYVASFTYPQEPCKLLPPLDYEPYLISFRSLKRVVWFCNEQGGIITDDTLRTVRRLAEKYPNIVGATVDECIMPSLMGASEGLLSLKEIDYVRSQFKMVGGRNLDFWVVLYRHNLEQDVEHVVRDQMNKVDVITYWNAYTKDLDTLEESFAMVERAAPSKRKLFGCYMWDFQYNSPIPLPLMQRQCRLGLEWLREGRIEGMMFLGNFLCDRGIEAVEWTRKWIQEVGDEEL